MLSPALALLLAFPARAKVLDPLADGRSFTQRFYAGDLQAIWDAFSPEMKRSIGSLEKLGLFRQGISEQIGDEVSVVNETVRPADPYFAYERAARFAKTNVVMMVQWTLAVDGTVIGFSIRPTAKEADSKFLDYQTRTTLRLPFKGEWGVAFAGRKLETNPYAFTPDRRFAYAFTVVRDGQTHSGSGSSNVEFYCFGQPVVAPAAGRIVAAIDGIADNRPGQIDPKKPLGNHVVIDHGNGEYSFLAFLRQGSLVVKRGDMVAAGDLLGKCGNSGTANQPNLHYYLQNSPDYAAGEGLPAQFTNYAADGRQVARGEPQKGQLVRSADPAPPPAAKAEKERAGQS